MNEQEVIVTGVKPSTVAMFEGIFGAIIGLAVAVLYLMSSTFVFTIATNTLLQGLMFGTTMGVLSLIVLPIVYFAIGWVIGYLNGFVFNLILRSWGGIALDMAIMEEQPEQRSYPVGQDSQVFGERIERHHDR